MACHLLRFGVEEIKKLGRLMYNNPMTRLKLIRKFKKFTNKDGEIV